MKHRCYGENLDPSTAKHYRDKGIRICSEWLNDPSAFVKWSLENGYKVGLSIDRINPDGDYEPSNCQWITLSENSKKAAEDRMKRKALQEKRRKEEEKRQEEKRLSERLSRSIWADLFDVLTPSDRSSIELAVSILKIMRERDKSARMADAITRSDELIRGFKEVMNNSEESKDQVKFAFDFACEFLKSL